MGKKFIVAIDLGGTNLRIAVLDLNYKIKEKEVLSTRRFHRKEGLISAIVSSVNNIIQKSNLNKTNILGIGLGLPGPINNRLGIVHFFPNIPGWREVKLKGILQQRLRLPVYLDNDAKLMAIAEYRLGKARCFKNVLCITLGTGVGGGIIIGGALYRGLNNAAGEIGHLPINENGPHCNCGGIACLEAYIGNKRIKEEARRLFRKNISLEELSELAKKKNKIALGIWAKAGQRLGVALTGAVNLLNLDAVIIGGGLANAGSVLLGQAEKTIQKQAMSVQAGHLKLFRAKLGNDAGLIGAGILVKESAG